MQISYIILAYNHPKQVERLVRRLSYDDVAFYIHIDKKSDVAGFYDALVNITHVTFIADADRVDCRWGDYSLMEAIMVCCKKSLQMAEKVMLLYCLGRIILCVRLVISVVFLMIIKDEII